MHLCLISSKECWRGPGGAWMSYGGFPLQTAAIGSIFDRLTMVVVEVPPREGGIPLPPRAAVVPLPRPAGRDLRRKLAVAAGLPGLLGPIVAEIRRADAVHVPLPGDIPLLALLAALALDKPILARYGSSWAATSQTTTMNRATKALMRLSAGGRRVMLVTGEGERAPAPRLEWIFSTSLSRAELEQIRPALDRGLAAPPRLIYAGRLSPEKGVAHLIDALAILRREGLAPPPLVTIAGDGPERAALEARARRSGVDGQLRFAGMLDRPRLAAALAAADVCVQPSLTEGYSKAWLDAMAHGLPVVTSPVGAAAAVVRGDGERGWLSPPGDAEALAATLRHVLTAPIDWPALRRRCRAFVEGRTLEAWSLRIGELCARQWGGRLIDGKIAL